MIYKLFGIFLILSHLSCVSFSIYNPHPNKNIILTQDTSTCLSSKTYKQWYAFYGSLSLNSLDSAVLFPSEDYAYRVTELSTVEDSIITFFLGLFTTMSRKTIQVDYCNLPSKVGKLKKKPQLKAEEEKLEVKKEPPKEEKIELKDKVESTEVENKKSDFVASLDSSNIGTRELNVLNKKLDRIMEKQKSIERLLETEIPIENSSIVVDEDEDNLVSYLEGIHKKLQKTEQRQTKLEEEVRELKELLVSAQTTKPSLESETLSYETKTIGPSELHKQAKRGILTSIYFKFNSSFISEHEREKLRRLVKKLSVNKKIMIVGHSDWIGKSSYNKMLSMRRAEAVRRELENILGDVSIKLILGKVAKPLRTKKVESVASWFRRADIVLLDNN